MTQVADAKPEVTTLGEVVARTGGVIQTGPFGSQLHASDYTMAGTPLVMPVNLGDNEIIEVGIARVGAGDVRRLKRHALREGDVVFSRRGDVGRRSIVRAEQAGWLCGTGCLAARFGSDLSVVNPAYVAQYLGSQSAQTWLQDNAVGGTLPNLNTSILAALSIRLPSRAEQDAIVATLEDAQFTTVIIERLIAKKQAIKQGMMQKCFALPDDDTYRARLGTLAAFLSGGTPDRSSAEYWSGSIPWISATTLKRTEVSTSDQSVTELAVRAGSKFAPLQSTLVLVRGSALHSEIRASLVTARVCFNQDVKALVPSARLEPKFLTYSIHANAPRLLRLVTSAGNTAGVLDTRVLKNFEIWLPDLEIQKQVVSAFDDVSHELEALVSRLDKAKAIKQGMMQQLLTGRTRLPVQEPAA